MNGYRPARTHVEYVAREATHNLRGMEKVGSNECPGLRWKIGPFRFEAYLSDREPQIDPQGPTRLVIWQPITRNDEVNGWWHSFLPANPQLTGYVEIRDPDAYWKTWTSHMQRHRAKWLKEPAYSIEDVSVEAFCKNYTQKNMASWFEHMMIDMVQKKVLRHGERTHLFGAFDTDHTMVAGFAVVDVPEGNQSIHLASFITPAAKRTSVGVGMVDIWFRRCIEKGYRYLDFDLFWAKGDPKSWKGFSQFKSQFGTQFIRYPKPYMKIVRG
jgi:hypothetical protein